MIHYGVAVRQLLLRGDRIREVTSAASSTATSSRTTDLGGRRSLLMPKRKKTDEEKDWDEHHSFTSVTCRLQQLCEEPDLIAEIQRSCVVSKQITSEAWHLANMHVLRCLQTQGELPRLDQMFFSWCCQAVRAQGLGATSSATNDFRETARLYRAERARVEGYTPPATASHDHNQLLWLAEQMRINTRNMIVLNFERRLTMYARLLLEERQEELRLMATEDRPALETASMAMEDAPQHREHPTTTSRPHQNIEQPAVARAEINRLVMACYRSNDGEFTVDEQQLRGWLELEPHQSVIERNLEHFVKRLYVILQKVEASQRRDPNKKGIRSFSLLPCSASYVPSHIIINRTSLHGFCARVFESTGGRNALLMPQGARAGTLSTAVTLQQKGAILRQLFSVSKFETMKVDAGISKADFDNMDHDSKAPFASRLFAHQITSDGYSASVLLTRPKSTQDLKIEELKKERRKGKKRRKLAAEAEVDYEWESLPSNYAPDMLIGVDPGMRNLCTAAREGEVLPTIKGAVQPRNNITQIHAREYRHLAGMNKQRYWFENLKRRDHRYSDVLTRLPSFKCSDFDVYLEHLRIYWASVAYLIEFCASHAFRKQRFMVKRMKAKTLDAMAKRVVPVASPQVIVGYGDWSVRDGVRGHGPTPVKGFRHALQKRARVVTIDEFCSSKLCSSCHHPLRNAVLPQFRDGETELITTKNVLRCHSSDCRALFWDRDVNAALNMLTLLRAKLRGDPRPAAFSRGAAVMHA